MADAGAGMDSGPTPMDAGARDTAAPPPPPPQDAGPPLPRFPGLSIECWRPPNSFCNPANNDGCEAGEACDVSSDGMRPIVACFPPPADQGLGDACSNDRGPFCAGGLRCMEGRCMDTCCDDSECTAPERCVPLDPLFGNLGVCSDAPAPMCAGVGGFCTQSSDCCSRNCHIDHCDP